MAQRLYPFAQLSPRVVAGKPSWQMSLWIAVVAAWVTFSVTGRTVALGSFANEAGVVLSCQGIIGQAAMFGILIVGIFRLIGQYEPLVWSPRLGTISRTLKLRPLVSSWDQFWLPIVPTIMIWALAAMFESSLTPAGFFVLVFVEVIILLRLGITPEEWQMTSDARLTSTFLSSGAENHRDP